MVAGIPRTKPKSTSSCFFREKSRHAERRISQDYAAFLRDHRSTGQDHSLREKRSVEELLEEVERVRAKRIEREEKARQRRAEILRKTTRELSYRDGQRLRHLLEAGPMHWRNGESLPLRTGRVTCLSIYRRHMPSKKNNGKFSGNSRFSRYPRRRKALMKRLDQAGLKWRQGVPSECARLCSGLFLTNAYN